REAANVLATRAECVDLRADVEIRLLHAHRHRSASGHGREERDLVARLDRRLGSRHALVDRRAHAASGAERLPGLAPRDQILTQSADARYALGQRELLLGLADRLSQAGEI